MCRWLLLSQDVTGSDQIPLTQEFLSHMLGVQRSSVSLCAHTLQKTGLIQYARGKIKIRDRKGLEECACECYAVTREYIASVTPPQRRTGSPRGVVLLPPGKRSCHTIIFTWKTAKLCLTTLVSSCATLPPPRTKLCEQVARYSGLDLALPLPCGMGAHGACG